MKDFKLSILSMKTSMHHNTCHIMDAQPMKDEINQYMNEEKSRTWT